MAELPFMTCMRTFFKMFYLSRSLEDCLINNQGEFRGII